MSPHSEAIHRMIPEIPLRQEGAVYRIELNRPDCGKLIETISSQPADALKAVKEYLMFAPLMEPRGRADFAASVIAGVLSSR